MGNAPNDGNHKQGLNKQKNNTLPIVTNVRRRRSKNYTSQYNNFNNNNSIQHSMQMNLQVNTNINLFPKQSSPHMQTRRQLSPTLSSLPSGIQNMIINNNTNTITPPIMCTSTEITYPVLNSSVEFSLSSYECKSPKLTDFTSIKGLSQQQLKMLQNHQNLLIKHKEQNEQVMNIFTGETMDICWVFWKDSVDILPRNKQKKLALLLYSHMFQNISSARRLFVRGEIDQQALKFLDMFGFLIRQIKEPDQSSLINTLKGLGRRHASWGVRVEYFEPMLLSLHASLSDYFKHTYTVRVKYCMEQLFTAAASIMTGHDLYTIFGTRYTNMKSLRFLDSLEMCFADDIGREYLQRFLIQSFCAEIVEYHSIYKQYRGALSNMERCIIGYRIVNQFLMPNSKYELNIKSSRIAEEVLKRLRKLEKKAKNGNVEMPEDLFDPIYEWIMEQIKQDAWPKFQSTIHSIAIQSIDHS